MRLSGPIAQAAARRIAANNAFSAMTGGGVAVPTTNLQGLWYASDYTTTPRKAVPNSVTVGSTALFGNLRSVSTYSPWNSYEFTSVSQTWAYADGPTGATLSAFRLVGTGNFYLQNSGLTNGQTYTVAADVKSNTGSSQNFRMGDAAGTNATKTATTSWQRFTQTFVAAGGPYTIIWSPDGTTGCDLVVDNVAVFSGSSDLGREALAGHFYINQKQSDTTVTNPATGVLDFSNSGSGIIQFPTAINTTAFTLSIMVKRGSATDSGYQAILSNPASYTNFTAFLAQGANNPATSVNGTGVGSKPGLIYRNGDGWHVITHRYDGTNYDIFVDKARVVRTAFTTTGPSLRTFLAFSLNGFGSFNSSAQMNSMALYSSALTDTDIRNNLVPALIAKLQADGQTYAESRIIIAEGDSISTNGFGNCYFQQFAPNATLPASGSSYGTSGYTLANITSRASTIDGVLPTSPGGKYILSVLIGANDLGGYTGASDAAAAANYTTDLMAYIAARRAAGWKVVACTILPRDVTAHNTRRAIVNANLRTQQGLGNIDGIADFDTDVQMGIDTAFASFPANWNDALHPNATGHARLEPIYRAAMNAL